MQHHTVWFPLQRIIDQTRIVITAFHKWNRHVNRISSSETSYNWPMNYADVDPHGAPIHFSTNYSEVRQEFFIGYGKLKKASQLTCRCRTVAHVPRTQRRRCCIGYAEKTSCAAV